MTTTGAAICFPSVALQNGLVVTANPFNAPQTKAPSYSGTVGPFGVTTAMDGTGNGYPLAPGQSGSFATANASAICVNGTAGDAFFVEGN